MFMYVHLTEYKHNDLNMAKHNDKVEIVHVTCSCSPYIHNGLNIAKHYDKVEIVPLPCSCMYTFRSTFTMISTWSNIMTR